MHFIWYLVIAILAIFVWTMMLMLFEDRRLTRVVSNALDDFEEWKNEVKVDVAEVVSKNDRLVERLEKPPIQRLHVTFDEIRLRHKYFKPKKKSSVDSKIIADVKKSLKAFNK